MKFALLALAGALSCAAQDLSSLDKPASHRNWQFSVGFMVGGSALDGVSSVGRVEMDPILGRGNYGARQITVQASAMVALPLLERWTIRRWPRSERGWIVANYVIGAAHVGAAVRNFRQ